MISSDLWDEQAEFDSLLRPVLPYQGGEEAVMNFVREMVMNIYSEGDELLRTTTWKSHRRKPHHRPNREHRLEEVIDMFKLWLSVAQGLGFTPEELRQAFWRKSMVVRQRHSEEWIKTIDRPAAVVDIDNVLCNYTAGFCTWIINRAPLFAPQAQRILERRTFFSSCTDFGMTETEWQGFKHEFRSMGHKRFLPVMDGAKEFLLKLREQGYCIILLTSRPIDRYPNIYTDTLYWLDTNELVYDWLWWAVDKGERLIENGALKHIRFVVDDDPRYIQQFAKLGLQSWWLQTTKHHQSWNDQLAPLPNVHAVTSLYSIEIPQTTQKGYVHA